MSRNWKIVKKGYRKGRSFQYPAIRLNMKEGKIGLSSVAQEVVRQDGKFDGVIVMVDEEAHVVGFKGADREAEGAFAIGREGQLSCKSLFSDYGLDNATTGKYAMEIEQDESGESILTVDLTKEPVVS